MTFINLILEYTFLQKALLVCLLTSICCGILGTYIVYRKMVFVASSISHASFAGVGLGLYLSSTINPIYFALFVSALFGILILYLNKQTVIESDTIIGIIMSFGMALGIIFTYITPGYQKELSSYLFGNILLTTNQNILLLIIVAILSVAIFIIFNKAIKYLSFDFKFYKIMGVPVAFVDYLMIILVSIAIIVSIRGIGIVLIMSILTLPQTISSYFTNSYNKIAVTSCFISFISMFLGLYFSYLFKIPTGATIVISLITLFIFTASLFNRR